MIWKNLCERPHGTQWESVRRHADHDRVPPDVLAVHVAPARHPPGLLQELTEKTCGAYSATDRRPIGPL